MGSGTYGVCPWLRVLSFFELLPAAIFVLSWLRVLACWKSRAGNVYIGTVGIHCWHCEIWGHKDCKDTRSLSQHSEAPVMVIQQPNIEDSMANKLCWCRYEGEKSLSFIAIDQRVSFGWGVLLPLSISKIISSSTMAAARKVSDRLVQLIWTPMTRLISLEVLICGRGIGLCLCSSEHEESRSFSSSLLIGVVLLWNNAFVKLKMLEIS